MRSRLFASLAAVAVLAACGGPADEADDAALVLVRDTSGDRHEARAAERASESAPSEGGPEAPISALCMFEYSPETLTERAFAFDGTVVDVRNESDPRAPVGDVYTRHVQLEVHRWFAGGAGEAVNVWMRSPVDEGDRLLVTGEPRWGGTVLETATAWECGFTTAYSEARAEEWSAAFADG